MAFGLTQVKTGLSATDQFLVKPEAISASERLAKSFPAGSSDPVAVVTAGDPAAVVTAAKAVNGVSGATVGASATAGNLTQVAVVLSPEPGTESARQAVRDLRTALHGIPETYVGGTEAKAVDVADASNRDRMLLFPLILGLVLLALVVLLRSIVAPIILATTVVATYLASIGAAWWIFTKVFGFSALDSGAPLLTFLCNARTGTQIVPKKVVQALGDEAFGKAPVGTGAYKLKAWKPNESISLAAHEDYFVKGQPSVATIEVPLPIARDSNAAQSIKLSAEYQGCKDQGICYPVMQRSLALDLPAGAGAVSAQGTRTGGPGGTNGSGLRGAEGSADRRRGIAGGGLAAGVRVLWGGRARGFRRGRGAAESGRLPGFPPGRRR